MKKDLKELISYVFVGGCTTLINFVIYWFVITMMDQGWLFAVSYTHLTLPTNREV